MEQCGEKKEKPTEEKVEQSLNVSVVWCLLEEMFSATLSIAALQIHHELAVVASMYDRPGVPHCESSATCVQWCKWGFVLPPRLHLTCTARLVKSGLIARTAAARPQALLGRISLHLLSPFRLLQPSVRPKLVLANIYLLLSSRSASTVFPLGCCSIHTLTCLSSDFG